MFSAQPEQALYSCSVIELHGCIYFWIPQSLSQYYFRPGVSQSLVIIFVIPSPETVCNSRLPWSLLSSGGHSGIALGSVQTGASFLQHLRCICTRLLQLMPTRYLQLCTSSTQNCSITDVAHGECIGNPATGRILSVVIFLLQPDSYQNICG